MEFNYVYSFFGSFKAPDVCAPLDGAQLIFFQVNLHLNGFHVFC